MSNCFSSSNFFWSKLNGKAFMLEYPLTFTHAFPDASLVSAFEIWTKIMVVGFHLSTAISIYLTVDVLVDGFVRDGLVWIFKVESARDLFR